MVMIGDGINDSVGFAGADVAIAVHGATDAARASADLICERPGLMPIAEAQIYARRVVQVVRCWNFGWAIAYNLLAIPFAIAGAVNPLVASVGMAGSSAIVLLNVMRLGVTGRSFRNHRGALMESLFLFWCRSHWVLAVIIGAAFWWSAVGAIR